MRDFFPILQVPGFKLPWALIEPHRQQAMKNHGQTLERLAERGGLSFDEAAAVLEDRKWSRIVWPIGHERAEDPARAYLERLIAAHKETPNDDTRTTLNAAPAVLHGKRHAYRWQVTARSPLG